MKRLLPFALLGLAACAQPEPEPILDYNAPYTGKFSAPETSIRPEPRPERKRWPACPEWPDDCGTDFPEPDRPTIDDILDDLTSRGPA